MLRTRGSDMAFLWGETWAWQSFPTVCWQCAGTLQLPPSFRASQSEPAFLQRPPVETGYPSPPVHNNKACVSSGCVVVLLLLPHQCQQPTR